MVLGPIQLAAPVWPVSQPQDCDRGRTVGWVPHNTRCTVSSIACPRPPGASLRIGGRGSAMSKAISQRDRGPNVAFLSAKLSRGWPAWIRVQSAKRGAPKRPKTDCHENPSRLNRRPVKCFHDYRSRSDMGSVQVPLPRHVVPTPAEAVQFQYGRTSAGGLPGNTIPMRLISGASLTWKPS